jgi:dipeptidase
MDVIRLGLERAATAAEALELILALLEQFGQGGNCGHLTATYYNNSFLIADRQEAFVVETVGKEWLVERVRGIRTLSNIYSIDRHAERTSLGLSALIRDSGWSSENVPCYASAIADPNREHIGRAQTRRARSASLLHSREGQIGAIDIMTILRDHGPVASSSPDWYPGQADISICMHAGAEDRPGQTTGALVSELRETDSVHWVTGTAAPCSAIFKPVLIGVPLPDIGTRPTDHFDSHTLWWRHERLHRAAISGHFGQFLRDIREERDGLEARFHTRVDAVLNGGNALERSDVIAKCWNEALETEDRWFARVAKSARLLDTPYQATWFKMNQIAGIDVVIDPEMNRCT